MRGYVRFTFCTFCILHPFGEYFSYQFQIGITHFEDEENSAKICSKLMLSFVLSLLLVI